MPVRPARTGPDPSRTARTAPPRIPLPGSPTQVAVMSIPILSPEQAANWDQRAEQAGASTAAMTLPELDALARREVAELGAVIRAAGITIE